VGVALATAVRAPADRSVSKPALIVQWKERLGVANDELKNGNWEKGRDIADSVLREMHARIISGEGSGDLLAAALLFRAIGAAGLNRVDDAAWDFGVAQSLYRPYEKVDLKPYGAAGAVLDRWRYTDGRAPTPPSWVNRQLASGKVSPPRRLRGDRPDYPLAKAASCVEKSVAIGTVIDEQGRTALPSLPQATDAVLALAAFDAVRTWRFAPAKQGGKPVGVFFVLTVNFRGC
jgi:hypothetical protein